MFQRVILAAAFSVALVLPVAAQSPATFDETIPPGANFDKAEFRLWIPPVAGPLRGITVLVPGSNGDGRAMADDEFWQAFARATRLAIVACRFTDKPHEQNFIEDYVNVVARQRPGAARCPRAAGEAIEPSRARGRANR